jgi:hypothetical protein
MDNMSRYSRSVEATQITEVSEDSYSNNSLSNK